MFGYHGKILHVDLTQGKISVEEPEETFYRRYFGGSAMGAQNSLLASKKSSKCGGITPMM